MCLPVGKNVTRRHGDGACHRQGTRFRRAAVRVLPAATTVPSSLLLRRRGEREHSYTDHRGSLQQWKCLATVARTHTDTRAEFVLH